MARFKPGDTVAATENMSFTAFGTRVRVGEKGVVDEVDEGLVSRARYKVTFDNGAVGWPREHQLRPA